LTKGRRTEKFKGRKGYPIYEKKGKEALETLGREKKALLRKMGRTSLL